MYQDIVEKLDVLYAEAPRTTDKAVKKSTHCIKCES